MRNLHLKKKTTRKSNSQISRLEAIHRLINRHPYQIEKVEDALSKIKSDDLTPFCLVYFKYLNVRHHFNCYKVENAIEHLELANGLLDDMDDAAKEFDIKVKHDEYHFTRAYIRFVLTTISPDDYETPFIRARAKKITRIALRFNPVSSKFIWLQKQLAA